MRWIVLFFLILTQQAWAGAVRLLNDTSYKLRAVVRAADGTYLGEMIVLPQQTMQWNDYWGGVGNYNSSQTPYTVTWYCLDGGGFGVCDNVPNAATINAFSCSGANSCRPTKKSQQPPLKGAPTEEYLQEQEIQQDSGPPQGMLE